MYTTQASAIEIQSLATQFMLTRLFSSESFPVASENISEMAEMMEKTLSSQENDSEELQYLVDHLYNRYGW